MTTPLAPQTEPPASLNYQSVNPAVPLWNPNAASCWSLVFSPIFGAWLVAKNWDALGFPEKARSNRMVAGILLLIFLCMPFTALVDSLAGISRLVGIACLLGWYFALGKPQVTYVKNAFGKSYRRRGWGAALAIALGLTVGYFFFCFGLGMLFALTHLIKV